jgi:beta-lactamase regulating signal transducer with metallopeptidase domain
MLSRLLEASIGGGIAVAIVWLLCRAVPRLSAATRTWLWWLAAARFIVLLVWTAPIPLPVLPPAEAAQITVSVSHDATSPGDVIPGDAIPMIEPAGVVAAAPMTPPASVWPAALNLIWIAGVTVAAALAVRDWRRAARLVAQSVPAPSGILDEAHQLSARLALGRTPAIRISADLETPLVIGVTRPVVLLPATSFARLSNRQQQMTLCHEIVHIKRADLRWGCVPALAEWLFFFNPFTRLAAREYALAREAACDAAVLEALDAAPQEYGRMLLELGVAQPRAGLAAAGASWSSSTLKRRLVMLNQLSSVSTTSRLLASVAVAIAAISIVPVKLVARAATPPTTGVVVIEAAIDAPTASTAPASTPAQATTTPKVATVTTTSSATKATTPAPKTAEQVRTAPQKTAQAPARTVWEQKPAFPWIQAPTVVVGSDVVLFRAPQAGAVPTTGYHVFMKTSPADTTKIIEYARTFRKENEAMVWFKRNDREYVVRDADTLKELEAIVGTGHLNVSPAGRYTPYALEGRAGKEGTPAPDVSARLQEIQAKLAELSAQLKTADKANAARRQLADLGRELETLGRSLQQPPMFSARHDAFNWISMSRAFDSAEVFAVLDRAIAKGIAQQVK